MANLVHIGIYLKEANFLGFDHDDLRNVQKIMEELGLNETVVSREWDLYALEHKIHSNFSQIIPKFRVYLKRRAKGLLEEIRQKELEEQDGIFDDVPLSLVVDRVTSESSGVKASSPVKSSPAKSTTAAGTTTTATKKEDDFDFDFNDNSGTRKRLGNPTSKTFVYSNRSHVGQVVLKYNQDIPTGTMETKPLTIVTKVHDGGNHSTRPDTTDTVNTTTNNSNSTHITKKVKYHRETPELRTKALKDSVDLFKDKFEESLCVPTGSEIQRIVGRVWPYDSETPLPRRFFLFKNDSRENPLFSLLEKDISEYCLYPGQILMVEGEKTVGSNFFFSNKIYYPKQLPFYQNRKECDDVNIMVAQGPFDLYGSYADYSPLLDFCNRVGEKKPNIAIFIGPFVDDQNPNIDNLDDSYNEVFSKLLQRIAERVHPSTKVIIVPSLRDINHDPMYPQLPFSTNIKLSDNFMFVPNPCTIVINDSFTIGINNCDIISHMESKCVLKMKENQESATSTTNTTSPTAGDKDKYILQSFLNQRTYYPLYPPQVPLGISNNEILSFPSFTPDIIIMPKQTPMIKSVDNVLFTSAGNLINPNKAGGYLSMTVTNNKKESDGQMKSPVSQRTNAMIINI
ncbi:hypothetical protein CYY_005832 [Polysphondylium violaceum]|uniref:DNA polymerase alpha subunit B n=1 Tax=Polysphondylium violaceum TaxID=133409 RepID=A0A8J4UYI7_9MYCE|nr:hypothetical protein CYY_005832 [Polysphondylium violaceum]